MALRRRRYNLFHVCRRWTRPMLACVIVAISSLAGAAEEFQKPEHQKTVLAFYATRRGTPAAIALDGALERRLRARLAGRLDFHAEYIDLARFPEPEYQHELHDFLRAKYAKYQFDVIVATSDAALDFARRYRQDLFPDAAVVFNASPGVDVGPNATGVVSVLNLRDTLQIASTIQPDTRRVVVVSGASAVDKFYETLAREQFKSFEGRLAVTYLSGLPLPELLRQLAQLPAHSIIYYLTIFEDGNGDRIIGADGLETVAAAANAPVYTWFGVGLDRGAVGGSLLSTDLVGERLGDLSLRVLGGEAADHIAVTELNANVVEFDWRQLQRWHIDERRLPPGSVVRFRQPGMWELYRSYIVAGTLVLLVQTTLIAGLLVQLRKRQLVERELRESEERFRLMADTAPVLIWRSRPDKLCEFFNRPWLEFTGRTLEQELGTGWVECVHPGDREECLRTYTSAFDSRQSFRMEYRLKRADGVFRWMLDAGIPRFATDGSFAGYIGSCIDITDRKEIETALHESQNRYALATAAGAVGVWDWNLDTNEIYLDPQLKQLLGYGDEEIRNRLDEWRQRVHPDDREALEARVQDCIQGRHDAYELELRMLHRNGGLRWFVSRASVMKRADGTPCRMVGTDTNITERKYAEQEIRDNEVALLESSEEIQNLAGRLIVAQEAERTRIARDLHDDVSQQLAGFSIALSNLKRQIGGAEAKDGEGDVQGALTSLQQRTIALAENIRYLSHDLHPGVLQHAGLVSALTAHCAELQRHQSVALTFDAADDVEPVDPEVALCLYRVAQEALRNVITHAGARRADVRLVRTGGGVELTIGDDGRGFDSAGDTRRGHGLGLVSINERVRLAGGTVTIASGSNSGTIVSVRIPMIRIATMEAHEMSTGRNTHAS